MRFCGEEAVVTVYNKHENGERIITRLATVQKEAASYTGLFLGESVCHMAGTIKGKPCDLISGHRQAGLRP